MIDFGLFIRNPFINIHIQSMAAFLESYVSVGSRLNLREPSMRLVLAIACMYLNCEGGKVPTAGPKTAGSFQETVRSRVDNSCEASAV